MLEFLPEAPPFGTHLPIHSMVEPQDPHSAQGGFDHCMRLSACLPLGGKLQVMENI